jgi:HTH-type transcriptional regulator/antitoxin MqsA
MNTQCADCGAFELQILIETETFQYKGKTLMVEVEYCRCPRCSAETLLPEQIERNDCRVRDAWRKVDGLLTGPEIVELRNTLGLSQLQAAQVFGSIASAFAKYESGAAMQSEDMDKLMRLALEEKPVEVFGWLREHSGLANASVSINTHSKMIAL